MEAHYTALTLAAVEENIRAAGWSKFSWMARADYVIVDWWRKNGAGEGIAVWDNDAKPYRYL